MNNQADERFNKLVSHLSMSAGVQALIRGVDKPPDCSECHQPLSECQCQFGEEADEDFDENEIDINRYEAETTCGGCGSTVDMAVEDHAYCTDCDAVLCSECVTKYSQCSECRKESEN